ncbi:MAG: beta-adaptin, partial [Watsoniomyces obsoletus]
QFVGQGRTGVDAIQQAAIEEQMENARENPLAAASVQGKGSAQAESNAENLLDIDFDGAAPASSTEKPVNGLTGLEGLAGTPQRVESPAPPSGPVQPVNNMDDLLGVFGNGNASAGPSASGGWGGMSDSDILNGFASMELSSNQPPPPKSQMDGSAGGKKANEDLLSLF